MTAGIASYATYVPYRRLRRKLLGAPGIGGTRAVASFDEDSTSMGVEAARLAVAALPAGCGLERVYFATSSPAYLDKTNATAIHAALGLGEDVAAYDFGGAMRSSVGALRAAADAADGGRCVLTVTSDTRNGPPGSVDEVEGGDAAAAVVFAPGAGVAELISSAGTSDELLDRWRLPGEDRSQHWEPRFAEDALVRCGEAAVAKALVAAGLTLDQLDHVVVCGSHDRAVRRLRAGLGRGRDDVGDDLRATVGNPGAAQPGILLAEVLDRARPGEVIVLVAVADGADALVFRTTAALADFAQVRPLGRQVAAGSDDLSYEQFLTWRGYLVREPPNRPDPGRPAAPPSYREAPWKFGLTGSRCRACATMHLPPDRVCMACHAVDDMTAERVSDREATVVTFTVDHLAYSLSPPVVLAVVDFDGGGRLLCELADVGADEMAVGLRVEMSFRRLFTAEGVHNYFWKAKPVRA